MIINPRWKKVFSDLWFNKTRTLLTILTISIGVFAVGFVSTTNAIMFPDMDADFQSANPSEARLYTDYFDDEMLAVARKVPGVAQVEGRNTVSGRLSLAPEQKVSIQIEGIPDPAEMNVNRLKPMGEKLPKLGKRQLALDYSSASLGLKAGERVRIELSDGTWRELTLTDYVHDVNTIPYAMSGQMTGYVTPETIEWLGGEQDYSEMLIRVAERRTDATYVSNIAKKVEDQMEKSGVDVYATLVFNPGRHFAADISEAMMMILGILGWTSVFLSAFLVINTISALMAQQIRPIGIMKAVGGRSEQILGMYVTLILALGVMAFLIAAPLSAWAGYQVSIYLAEFLNFQLGPFRMEPEALILQAAIALGAPLLAALTPILNGVRITVREALSQYGLAATVRKRDLIEQGIEKVRFLSRPFLLSVRNTFRRKARLALNLTTLTLGGAIFLAIMNLWASMHMVLAQVQGYILADVNVSLAHYYRVERLHEIAMSIPGVEHFEGWGNGIGQLENPGGKAATQIQFLAPPASSTLIKPVLTAGRWLEPGDENAVVIGNHLQKARPDLKIGDTITIKLNNKDTSWRIVGAFRMAGNMPIPILYANYDYVQKALAQVGQVAALRLVTTQHDAASQKAVAEAFQAALKQQGITISDMTTGTEFADQLKNQTEMLVYFLLVMAILIAVVGGIGLMGTMSMNVMERTREIAVMRAIGANNQAIQVIVLGEGLLVALISWGLALPLSLPLTQTFDYGVGTSMFQMPFDFIISSSGLITWLTCVLVIAAIASALPAWRASQLTIREALAYE